MGLGSLFGWNNPAYRKYYLLTTAPVMLLVLVLTGDTTATWLAFLVMVLVWMVVDRVA
ncbi:hypothetical protein [Haloarchaeobius amylolyticus]|uniref:hypothetical protein n=1 Tax=Haloarchaeobius amylolyticus TaxID=1198296 RepID=UPI00226DBEBA|nr:hypothetical protein [Haloarchaeobius amylolyticus]